MSAVIFVDGQNVFHGGKEYGQNNDIEEYLCDVSELKALLSEDYDVSRAYWFDAFNPDGDGGKFGFFHKLESEGYQVEKRPLRLRGNKHIVKGVDVSLVTKLISLLHRDTYDTAILVSGDDDFRPAVEEVQDLGKTVVVASFSSKLSADLRRQADDYVRLDDHGERLRKN